jgi:hypothetical protein
MRHSEFHAIKRPVNLLDHFLARCVMASYDPMDVEEVDGSSATLRE